MHSQLSTSIIFQASMYLRHLTGVIKFLVVHPNVEIPARRDARANKHWTQSQINEERKTVASGMGDIQAGGKGGAPAKAKVEDYNKFPLKKEKGGLGFAFCGGKDTGYVSCLTRKKLMDQESAK